MKPPSYLIIVVVLMLSSAGTAVSNTVHLSAAASMTDVFQSIIAEFRKVNPDTEVMPNFGSSGSLAKQIAQGAPADIFVSANPSWGQYLLDQGYIHPPSHRVFACNGLVFIGAGAEVGSFAELLSLQRIALGVPQSVPAGHYAWQSMMKAGVYEALHGEHKLVFAKDVRQALVYAERGEVDGAFVYRTDARLARTTRILFSVPAEMHDDISYSASLTRRGQQNPSAADLFAFLESNEVAAVLQKYGFERCSGNR